MYYYISVFVLGLILFLLGITQLKYPLDFRMGALGMLYPDEYKKQKVKKEVKPFIKYLIAGCFIGIGGILMLKVLAVILYIL